MKIQYLICLLMLSGCASTNESEMLRPSDLNSNPKLYEGKLVDVEGYLVVEFVTEFTVSSALWDSKRKYQKAYELDDCITLRNSEVLISSLDAINFSSEVLVPSLDAINFSEVKLRGIFKEDIISGINLHICNSTGLELVEIIE